MSRDHKVKLAASDGRIFEVDVLVACESQTVKNVIEDTGTETAIPLPDVSSNILSKVPVIEYCRYHVESQESSDENPPVPDDEINQWDAEFANVDFQTLCALIRAANYLNIQNLLHLTCQTIADIFKITPVEELKKFLLVNKNDSIR